MNSRFLSTSAHLLAVILLAIPLSALAKQKAVYGEFAADFNGCISEEVFIHARSSKKSTNAKVTFSIYRQDVCRDEPILMVKADKVKLINGELIVDDELSGASLNGTIIVVDKSTNERFEVTLSLSWKADGDLILADTSRDMTEPPSDEEELTNMEKYKIAYRDASVRGTIEVDGDQLKFGATRGASLVSTDLRQLDVE